MDLSNLQDNYKLILETFAIILVLYCLSFLYKTTTNPPEASGAWPIIGHYKIFSGSDLPHVPLSSMADQYGPIFTVRLGVRKVLVVSSWDIVKDIFTTHDLIVSNRPNYIATKILGHNGAFFSFAPYGPYWRGIRKIISQEVLSKSRLEKINHLQVFELENSIENIHELWREKRDEQGKMLVEMKKWFGELNMNIMLKVVVGKRYNGGNGENEEEMRSYGEVISEWFQYLGQFLVADALPFLDWLDLGGYKKIMKRVARELDYIVGKWLEEHRRKSSFDNVKEENDFMDVLIQVVEDDDVAGYNADTIIKATSATLIAGGSDTTTVMLTWTLSLLLNNPYALRKAQEELDMQVGHDRQVNESDIKNLCYLHAVVKETLRLYPATFLNATRVCTKDCTIAGYHVPKGTWLIVNTWKLHRDPNIWQDPCEFRPERFLSPNQRGVDVIGTDFEMIPFGAGRRRCPGIGLACQTLHMVLATLLHNFDISTPNGEPVDMSATAGLTNAKATPLEVLISPRLHATIDA
ncbi:putative cytochrome P450 [Helianthus annuus]|nr:putative cytochrome P450 [Helianthus annuus]KAJ0587562.1 putative cytochrome P450 [Helianthus annuus]KAJ0596062.1 putative cytochrome P450 [Helianthus annuus]KAJ0756713.1 putative cytochrome P450 [Helianthus annuus]KAJ0760463.1 putative cytochrome P450 [Helianthus annuus]